MNIAYATTNPAKLEEARFVLQDETLTVLGLRDFPGIQPIAETGSTFEENAVLKAKGYFAQIGIPCIGDDGGLVVDYLEGAPGVHSHRWLGYDATDQELAEAIVKKMEGVPQENRAARLGGVVAFWDGARLLKEEHWLEGYIALRVMDAVTPGFPYRPILMIPQFEKPYSALTHEEHEQVNFRRKNLKALKEKILPLLH